MRVEYDIEISVDVGEVLPSVGEMLGEVNKTMAGFGFSEKLCVRGKPFNCTFSAEREITDVEKHQISEIILGEFHKRFPRWRVAIEKFALK